MKNLFNPLTDEEIDLLGECLLGRIDDDTDTEGKDEGILDVSELDGLFTAIVSGPVAIAPSQWLPIVWGDFEPVWESVEAFEEVLILMMRHMNEVAGVLMQRPENFEPLLFERQFQGKTVLVVDEWCEGYMRGVALAADIWQDGGEEMKRLLVPIRAFTEETDWAAHELVDDAEFERVRDEITPNIRAIHAWWLARRKEYQTGSEPVRHIGPRIGRNDPCPCGSGKKYKKCCLQ